MPKRLVVCPACGLDVPPGEFCKFCGEILPSGTEIHHSGKLDDVEDTSSDIAFTDSLPEFNFNIQGVEKKTLAILLAHAELGVINRELDRLIQQTRATRQALSLEHADRAVLTARAEKLRKSLEMMKDRRRVLLEVKGMVPLERTTQDLKRFEGKLVKLDEIVDSLDSVVYEEQRRELVEEVKQLKTRLKSQLNESKGWVKEMESRSKDIQRDMSRLDAKFKIGDISDTEYTSAKYKLERTISIIDGALVGLEEIIEAAKEA